MRGYTGTKTIIDVHKIKNSIKATEKIVKNKIEKNFHNTKEELNLKFKGGTQLTGYCDILKKILIPTVKKDSFRHGEGDTQRDVNKAVLRLPKNNIQCQKPRSNAYNILRPGEITTSVTDTAK